MAGRQHSIYVKLKPRRGSIYDRHNRILALYLDVFSVYAVPEEIDNKESVSEILAKGFGLDKEIILGRLRRYKSFAWIKRKIKKEETEKVKSFNLKGIYLMREAKRFYPSGILASHILGLVGIDDTGLEGVELYYDRQLRGEYGWKRLYRDAKRREIILGEEEILPSKDGNSLVLTIDEIIQHIIEKEIESIVEKFKPEAISIIAMNPATGEILALANFPSYNPNHPNEISRPFLRNRAISDSIEPGSIFKIVTMAAAIEEGIVDFDTKFFCENGIYKIGNRILHDYRPYGTLTFREIIEKSSNIGVSKIAQKLGKYKLAEFIEKFGFGRPTGIDLPGEAKGIVRDVTEWSYTDLTTIPMGQGIACTPLQLAVAISTIANDGIMMKPHIVKEIIGKDGKTIVKFKPTPVRRVVSKRTVLKCKDILKGVIEHGTGKRAKLIQYTACGKTGTAQKVNPDGGYYKDKFIASFIGFAPYRNPKLALVICVDSPKGKHFGGVVAAPAFRNIVRKVFSYLEIKPDRDETQQNP